MIYVLPQPLDIEDSEDSDETDKDVWEKQD